MQQALDALDIFYDEYGWGEKQQKAHEALRARLAQPEQEPVATLFGSLPVYDVPPKQEPVAWVETLENAQPHCVTDLKYCSVMQHERGEHLKYIPLYTVLPQREWQGLTDEEILEEYRQSYGDDGNLTDVYFARAIEAKLKEKNT